MMIGKKFINVLVWTERNGNYHAGFWPEEAGTVYCAGGKPNVKTAKMDGTFIGDFYVAAGLLPDVFRQRFFQKNSPAIRCCWRIAGFQWEDRLEERNGSVKEETGQRASWHIRINYTNDAWQDISCYDGQLDMEKVEELYFCLLEYFEKEDAFF